MTISLPTIPRGDCHGGGLSLPERDELFTYSGLDLLLKRYVIQSRSRVPLETPQEMFLGIALHLAMNEGSDRMGG